MRVLRRVLVVVLSMSWAAVVLSIAVSSLPYNPASIRVREERNTKTLMPEGWGFFTRNPREPDLDVLVRAGDKWQRLPNMPISSYANAFGMNRLPRAQSVELAMLMNELDETSWTPCDKDLESCLAGAKAAEIQNRSPNPTLSGTLCLVRQEPVPWAWARSRDTVVMPSLFVVIDVHAANED